MASYKKCSRNQRKKTKTFFTRDDNCSGACSDFSLSLSARSLIYVPETSLEAYKTILEGKGFSNIVVSKG